jgi:hypothetical protein
MPRDPVGARSQARPAARRFTAAGDVLRIASITARELALATGAAQPACCDVTRGVDQLVQTDHRRDARTGADAKHRGSTVPPDRDSAGTQAGWPSMSTERPRSAEPCPLNCESFMSNPRTPHTGSSSEPPAASAPEYSLTSLVTHDRTLPHVNVDIPSKLSAEDVPHRLGEHDLELMEFLVQRAIETCMPARPQSPLPPGTRPRPVRRRAQRSKLISTDIANQTSYPNSHSDRDKNANLPLDLPRANTSIGPDGHK